MHYALKLRVIVCSSLENIAHPVLLSHRTPWHKMLALKTKFQTEKKAQRAEGRVEGCCWADLQEGRCLGETELAYKMVRFLHCLSH